MTCIVAVKGGSGSVWLGADTVGANDWQVTPRADSKIVTITGDDAEIVCGYTTSFRMGQILRHHVKLPPKWNKELDDWLVVDVIEAIREAFANHGWDRKEDKGEQWGGSFIMVSAGRIFTVQDDFQLAESRRSYDALGCGQYNAMGALYATEGQSAKARVETALNAAAELNPFVRGPFEIVEIGGTE